MLVRIANQEDPDQTLIWDCTVCLCLFDRQLVFKILDLDFKHFSLSVTK